MKHKHEKIVINTSCENDNCDGQINFEYVISNIADKEFKDLFNYSNLKEQIFVSQSHYSIFSQCDKCSRVYRVDSSLEIKLRGV